MSNGHSGLGGIQIKQDEGTYGLYVGTAWTSADDWVTLSLDLSDKRAAYLDIDQDDARQIAALLLEATGNQDLAAAIPADMARREARERDRVAAAAKLHQAADAAKKAFLDATAEQRAAFNAAIDEAEHAYGEVSGEGVCRSITLSDPATDPWSDIPA
jgi:hypothetical protein